MLMQLILYNIHCYSKSPITFNTLETYSKLIHMGFDEELSLKAAHKHPKNISKAIDFVATQNKEQIHNEQPINNKDNISVMETKTEEHDQDPCQIEFIQFLDTKVKLNKQYPNLYDQFKKIGYNDIRLMYNIDEEMLKNNINMKPLHCKVFMKKIELFRTEVDTFKKWIKEQQWGIEDSDYYSNQVIDRFRNKGILTFEMLYSSPLNKKDLIQIIGDQFTDICNEIWQNVDHSSDMSGHENDISIEISEIRVDENSSDHENQQIKNETKVNEVLLERFKPSQLKNKNICHGKNFDQCDHLNRIIYALKWFGSQSNMMKISKYLMDYKCYLINDHHHILEYHLNEDIISQSECDANFSLLYDILISKNNLFCDIAKCKIYLRNNRERENDDIYNQYDKSVIMYGDILQFIHCYYIHSVDTGYRIINKWNNDVYSKSDNNISYDNHLFQLRSYLQAKRQKLQDIRGGKRFSNNKFMTEIATYNFKSEADESKQKQYNESKQKLDDEQMEEKTENEGIYNFGLKYNYWKNKPKYACLKNEMINNKICKIELKVYKLAYEKAIYLLKNSDKIKKLKGDDEFLENADKLKHRYNGQPIGVQNVLTVVFYTDYDTLSYNFSSTFRKLKQDETNEEVLQRNKEYFNWSKMLCETVNIFGTQMKSSKIKAFYHGVSLMYFTSFVTSFNGPTSTTTKLQVATIFAKNDGIILNLNKYDGGGSLSNLVRYFNCTFISQFANEDERLFIQSIPEKNRYRQDKYSNMLQFVSIRNMETNENYAQYIGAFTKLHQIIEYPGIKLSNPVSAECVNIINDLLASRNDNQKNKCPDYITKTFRKWCCEKRVVNISIRRLKYTKGIQLLERNVNNLLAFDKINMNFKRVEEITCHGIGDIVALSKYLGSLISMIESINLLKYSKLERIMLFDITNMEIFFDFIKNLQFESAFTKNNWKIQIDEITEKDSRRLRRFGKYLLISRV
eukprot:280033_1